MRVALAVLFALSLAAPAWAAGQITCDQIPAAQRFVAGLKPGPNTREAQRHLEAARKAKSDKDCVTELGRVNYYAKRSAAADKRLEGAAHGERAKPVKAKPAAAKSNAAKPSTPKPIATKPDAPKSAAAEPALHQSSAVEASDLKVPHRKPPLPIKCADPLHQDRPGGSDYRGPPVPGCKRVL